MILEDAIKRMNDLIHTCDVGIIEHGEYDDLFLKDKQAIEKVLQTLNKYKQENINASVIIRKQNLIIDEMAEDLAQGCNYEEFEYQKQKIKEYFKNKVEKE